MAKGSLNLLVGKKDFLDRINKIETTMTKLNDVITRYGDAKKNLDQFMGDTDDNYEAMIARIDANVKAAKKAIKKAFQNQIDGKGFSLVEVISTCPTNWGLTPKKALEWVDEKMIPYYPLGVYKDRSAKEAE